MIEGRYICCRNCNEVHHVTPFDKAPEYIWDDGEAKEIPRDDWRDFMHRHAGHRLEALRSVAENCVVSGEAADPMKVDYIEVTNGHDLFLIRSHRKNIEEPLSFELVQGRLTPAGVSVEVQENELRKELKHHFPWRMSERISDDKIELFIGLFKEMVASLRPDEIEICGPSYADTPAEYGSLESAGKEALIEKCQPYFSAVEIEEIKRFIETHAEDDGVMTLRLAKLYMIEESREPLHSR
jgi:hypothetical protein